MFSLAPASPRSGLAVLRRRPPPPPPAANIAFPGAAVPVGGRRTTSRSLPAVKAGVAPGEETRTVEVADRRCASSPPGMNDHGISTVGRSTNIKWHQCPVGKLERQKLLKQKGCVLWITGLSGSGKSTLASALSRELHEKGYLTYVLDGDNLRHGLTQDLSFREEDRAENIRRVGEVAKLFADAGVICIASLISPYRRDRDACRALLPDSSFIEVFMNVPLEVCEARDAKGLYKLARAGKIKANVAPGKHAFCSICINIWKVNYKPAGFTGIDDPYEPPLDCEIVIHQKVGECHSPKTMAEQVIAYLNENGYLHA